MEPLSHLYYDLFPNHASSTRIILEALAGDPGEVRGVIRTLFSESDLIRPEHVFRIFEDGKSSGHCRDIDPRQVVISLIGMNLMACLLLGLVWKRKRLGRGGAGLLLASYVFYIVWIVIN